MPQPHLLGNHDECEALTRDALGNQAYGDAFRTGAAVSIDDAVAYALGDQRADKPPTKSAVSVLTRRETEVANLVAPRGPRSWPGLP
ncbi:hypothetical protein JOE46_004226 [Rhodococcus sp. PvR099]|nr:hypothetical protein [Rhodococcus sp. PvR099]